MFALLAIRVNSTGAPFVLDHDLLPERFGKLRLDGAGDEVEIPSWREGNDELDRAIRVGLRLRGSAQKHSEDQQQSSHGWLFPVVFRELISGSGLIAAYLTKSR